MKKINYWLIGLLLVSALFTSKGTELRRASNSSAAFNFNVYNNTNQKWTLATSKGKQVNITVQPKKNATIRIQEDTTLNMYTDGIQNSPLEVNCFSNRDSIFSHLMLATFSDRKAGYTIHNTSTKSSAYSNKNLNQKFKVTLSREIPSLKENKYGNIEINNLA